MQTAMNCRRVDTIRGWMLCALAATGLSLGGCAGMMKSIREDLSDEIVDFYPVFKAQMDARSGPATVSKQGAQELEKADYINIGDLLVKYIDSRCFPNEGCKKESHSGLPTARLLSEAAGNGGDIVLLTHDNASRKGQAVKNGRCLRTETVSVPRQVCNYETECGAYGCSTRQTYCNTVYTYQEQCAEWEKIYGDEFSTFSSASVWRKDPDLVTQVRFGDDFFKAIAAGQTARVKALAAKGMRADVQDLRGRYPLQKAAEANQTSIVRYLLEQGARPEVDNSRALVTASEKNNAQMVELMLEHGADPNAKIGFWDNAKPEEGKPLINAAGKKNLDMARTLLKHNADPNVEDGQPLKEAVRNSHRAMVDLLLNNGASVSEDGVLTAAIDKNDIEIVRLFLDKGANPDNRAWSGLTPLQSAAQHNHVDLMRVLLEKGADVNKRGFGGSKTPLLLAVEGGHVEAVRLLLEHKADVTIDDVPTGVGWMASLLGQKGRTPLSIAKSEAGSKKKKSPKQKAYQEIVDMLVAAGATE